MALQFWGFIKGILIQNESDRTKDFALQVSNSATTGTRTILQASQTANRTITLPDTDGTLTTGAAIAQKITGPAGATDEAVVRFDGASGTLAQNSLVLISDLGAVTGATQLNVDNIQLNGNTVSATSGDLILDGVDIDVNTNIIKNVVDPVGAQDAATKNYVDSAITTANAANRNLSNLDTPTAINQHLLPNASNTLDLGANGSRWRTLYIHTSVQLTSGVELGYFRPTITTPSGASASIGVEAETSRSNALVSRTTSAAASGAVYVETGNNSTVGGDQDSGLINIKSGNINDAGNVGDSGAVSIASGNTAGAGASGNLNLTAGTTTNADNRGEINLAASRIDVTAGVIRPLRSAADPTTLSTYLEGDYYYNTTTDKLRIFDGSIWKDVGGSGFTNANINSDVTLGVNTRNFVDTTAARTLDLPAAPADGDEVIIKDVSGQANANPITVDRNGNNIESAAADQIINSNFGAMHLVFRTALGWYII